MSLDLATLLTMIAALLFFIWMELRRIGARTRERFPTEKEADHDFAMRDPMGHWEVHKDDE